jgi:endonuclease-3 related protein
MDSRKGRIIRAIYARLLEVYGPQHWWPAETPFEVIVGAILVQNTNWGNVEKAISMLMTRKVLSCEKLLALSSDDLAQLVRPAGYFRVKERRLRNALQFMARRYRGSTARMARRPLMDMRQELLAVNGIGPETADSILLYALHKPVFVVDAYTRRLLSRHGFPEGTADYANIQALFMRHLPLEEKIFNEYHALIVRLGKDFKGGETVGRNDYSLQNKNLFL